MELRPGVKVVAKKPGSRRRRLAIVQEAVTRNVNDHVKVKFPGSSEIYSLPWVDIDVEQIAPAQPVRPSVSTTASSETIVDLDVDQNAPARPASPPICDLTVDDMGISNEARTGGQKRGPFAPTEKSRGVDGAKISVEMQTSLWLRGQQLVPDGKPGAGKAPLPSATLENTPVEQGRPNGSAWARSGMPNGLQAGLGLDFRKLPVAPRNTSLGLNISRPVGGHPGARSASQPPYQHSGSLSSEKIMHLRYARTEGTRLYQERSRWTAPQRQKRKEGQFEFKPSGTDHDRQNHRLLSPSKRPRTDSEFVNSSVVSDAGIGDHQRRVRNGSRTVKLTSRHPENNIFDDVSICRNGTDSEKLRIPRKVVQREPVAWASSPDLDIAFINKGSPAKRTSSSVLDGQYRATDNSTATYQGNEPLAIGSSPGRSRSRVDADTFSLKVIKKRRPPTGPVGRSFKETERFPFAKVHNNVLENNLNGSGDTNADAKVLAIVEKATRREEEIASDQISEVFARVQVSEQSYGCRKRRKSKPTQWSGCTIPRVTAGVSVEKNDSVDTVGEESFLDEGTDLRICDCICGHVLGQRRAMQCGLCGLWSHLSCIQACGIIRTKRDKFSNRRFMCEKCSERTLETDEYSGKRNAEPTASFSESAETFFCGRPRIPNTRNFEAAATMTIGGVVAPSLKVDGRDKVARTVRPPLTPEDISERAANVELLRSGIPRASVGKREQGVIDVHVHRPGWL